MANEKIGSVHGEIIIDYDDKGVARVRMNVKGMKDDVEGLDETLKTSSKNQAKNAKAVDSEMAKLRKTLSKAHDDMEKLDKGVMKAFLSIAKSVGLTVLAFGGLGGGLQLLGALVGAAVALSGALAIIPGAIAAIGLAGVTLALAKKGFEDFKKDLSDLKPAFDDLRNAVSQTLFAGLAREVRDLATTYLPMAKTGFVGIAQALNEAAKGALAFFSQSRTKADLAILFEASRVATGNLANAFVALLPAFRDIGTIGAMVFASLTGGAVRVAESFSAFIARIRETGELETFMRNGIQAVKDLGAIVMNVFGILNQLVGAVAGDGQGLLTVLRALTQGALDWMHSMEGSAVIAELGKTLAVISRVLQDVFLAAIKQIGPIFIAAAPGIRDVAIVLRDTLVPALETIGPMILNLALWFSDNATALGPLLIAFAAFAIALKVATVAFGLFNAVMALNPFVLIAAAIIALIILVVVYWDEIVAFLTSTWNKIVELAKTVWNGIVDFFKGIFEGISGFVTRSWTRTGNDLQAIWQGISDFFTGIWTTIRDFVVGVVTAIGTTLTTIWTNIVNNLRPIIEPIVSIIQSIFEIAWTIVSTVMQLIWIVIQAGWNLITSMFQSFVDGILLIWNFLWGGVVSAVTTIWDWITQFLSMIWNGITTAFHTIFDPIIEWWTGFWSGIRDWVSAVVSEMAQIIGDKWDEVVRRWHQLFDPIAQWFSDVWNNVSNSARDGIQNVIDFVGGLAGRIWDAVSGAADWLYQTGRNVVIGFLNGLKNMFGDAVQSIKNFCNDIVASAKSILGIHSPSIVFRAFGEFTMQGYEEGINSLKARVIGTMGSIAAGIVVAGELPKAAAPVGVLAGSMQAAQSSISNSTRAVNIAKVDLNVQGNFDPTNPVAWRNTTKRLRDDIRNLEGEYSS